MKRREFMKFSVSAAAAVGVSAWPDLTSAKTVSNKKIVYIFLRGAADVLSLFPPHITGAALTDYSKHPLAKFRGTTESMAKSFLFNTKVGAESTRQALKIGNHNTLFHPDFSSLSSVISSDNLAVILHTGSKNTTRSHFDQMDYIESGSVSRKLNSGFLARASSLAAEGGRKASIAIGTKIPKSLLGLDVPLVAGLDDIKSAYDIQKGRVNGNQITRSERLELLKPVEEQRCDDNLRCQMIQSAQSDYDDLEKETNDLEVNASGTFLKACQLTAALTQIKSNPPVLTIDFEGWDHHFRSLPTSSTDITARKIKELSDGLNLLYQYASPETVVVVMSEFGRTVVANSSMGTDHGRGSAMIVMGKKIKRSKMTNLQSSWDLSSFEGENQSAALTVKIDYREVLAEIIENHLGVNLTDQAKLAQGVKLPVFDNLNSYTKRNIV